jgi:FAS-associated factor 2
MGLGYYWRCQSNQVLIKHFFLSLKIFSFRLTETFKRCLGHQYAQRISAMDKDAYPLLLVLIRSRGSLELISVIEGKSTPSEVLLNLIQSHELFEQQRQRDAEEEISREKREGLKKEQEDEYHRSLQADLAKEQAKKDDERRQKEEENANERLKQQRLVNFSLLRF